MHNVLSRRRFVASSSTLLGIGALSADRVGAEPASADSAKLPSTIPGEDYRIQNGLVKQSVMGWCFNPLPTEQLIDACHRMAMPAMEGISRQHYPRLRKLGMNIAIVGSHGFQQGPTSSDNHTICREKLREAIDVAVEFSSPNVITFTGMREKGVSDKQAEANCVEFWKSMTGYAEEKGINLCLEHLNSRDGTHPMKGHPGYFGDDVDYCVDMIKQVDSPRMKLLFDIYHVQIMNGDVIRRIEQYKDVIGHYHTAGVPGRGELDETQEINYPAVIRKIVDTGYQGFLAQEFIPTWDDKLAALRHGVQVCDV